jgi:methionine-rich copper-binding protein CopC
MKRFAGKFAKGLAVALLGLMTWASPRGIPAACAHSVLVSSEPKIDETVTPGPRDLTLVFDSRVDPHRSRIFMTLPDGARQTLTPELGQTQGTLILHVDQLPAGQIYLNYEVLSVDGHIARGVVKFTVAAQ